MAQKEYPNVRIGWTRDLPFALDSEATEERWKHYKDKMEEALVVTMFGTEKFEMLGERTIIRTKIFNDKINQWQEYDCRFYYGICSICGKLMKVIYIPGTSWLAACSRECYEEMDRIRTSPTKPKETEAEWMYHYSGHDEVYYGREKAIERAKERLEKILEAEG